VIVLSNGIMMSTASWFFQTMALSKHFRVLWTWQGCWMPWKLKKHISPVSRMGLRSA
jgi:hypothetical protein